MNDPQNPSVLRRVFTALGPALITACVVIGPGSILVASKMGSNYEYRMLWVILAALVLMIGTTALSARLGVTLKGTLCDELAQRLGRWVAAVAGISLFLVAACFQFGNNLGVMAAVEPFVEVGTVVPIVVIVGMNVLIVLALYGFKKLYDPIETLMKIMVGLMLVGFAGNLLLCQPEIGKVLKGFLPTLPEGAAETIMPQWQQAVVENGKTIKEGKVVDNLGLVTAMVATTFSIGGAFYQSYLVRQKGWKLNDVKNGLIDSTVGIGILGLISLMIMITSAAVLHGKDISLNSAADVAKQLEPAFGGPWAKILFCVGIFAGAFSSFLVNAMIGGTILSDGLGLGGNIDQKWPKAFTVLALATGMVVAIWIASTGQKPVNLIVFAQAMTVLAVPVLAGALLYLATRSDLTGERSIPAWMKTIVAIGLAVVLFLAVRKAIALLLPAINQ